MCVVCVCMRECSVVCVVHVCVCSVYVYMYMYSVCNMCVFLVGCVLCACGVVWCVLGHVSVYTVCMHEFVSVVCVHASVSRY